MPRSAGKHGALRARLRPVRRGFWFAAVLSMLFHVVLLIGLLFLVQIFDRVLSSGIGSVLTILSVLVGAVAFLAGLIAFSRNRVLSRLAAWLDAELSPLSYRSWMLRSQSGDRSGYKPMHDVGILRDFLTTPTMLAVFDVSWMPFYGVVVALLHWHLGALVAGAALMVVLMVLFSDLSTGFAQTRAAQDDIQERRFAERSLNGADAVLAMGMLGQVTTSWYKLRNRSVAGLQTGWDRAQLFAMVCTLIRVLVTGLVLLWGMALLLEERLSVGGLAAATVLTWLSLGPLDRIAQGWPLLKRARLARQRLMFYLSRDVEPRVLKEDLPAPSGALAVEHITAFAPRSLSGAPGRIILSDISFTLEPGEALGIVGPSAAGKSTLARILVGLQLPDRGAVRLDSHTVQEWSPEKRGRHIGYVPQDVRLLPGTIAQNITRFDPDPNERALTEAAELAGVLDVVTALPEGFATEIDPIVSPLTGGQTQRVALARAMYQNPRLIVLDEPQTHLDADGQTALAAAIATLSARGATIVVTAHNPTAVAGINRILMLDDGAIVDQGEKSDILRRITRSA
ncbi:type I secretion system permease/ATPase [Actibacterium sp. 188UL27-1]|uniref:type I secretion system permease/ATPase n=1 Tax=Actibacterium sp. 188UL27-1 TaxID=2786961 RepID=UPI001958DF92|nr:ATP-binding cassette domain-containing protein [Actibacterium sp. 188UL27-1]MBM7067145.1 ATP-binding cassette domain-containing protein [Actibacterium sp. 188UL27-1]